MAVPYGNNGDYPNYESFTQRIDDGVKSISLYWTKVLLVERWNNPTFPMVSLTFSVIGSKDRLNEY